MRGVLLVALGCVSAATGIVLSKHPLESAPLLPFVLFQVLGGALSATAACFFLRSVTRGKDFLLLALPGIFQPGLTYPLYFASLAYISLALAGMLASFETLFVFLLSFPLLKVKPRCEQFCSHSAALADCFSCRGAEDPRLRAYSWECCLCSPACSVQALIPSRAAHWLQNPTRLR